jgi:hypothetical protein
MLRIYQYSYEPLKLDTTMQRHLVVGRASLHVPTEASLNLRDSLLSFRIFAIHRGSYILKSTMSRNEGMEHISSKTYISCIWYHFNYYTM